MKLEKENKEVWEIKNMTLEIKNSIEKLKQIGNTSQKVERING